MSMNFIEDTRIDPNNLHYEWIKQATLYAEWSERHVNAIRDRDLLKIKVDAYCARLGNKVRTNWMHLGFDRPAPATDYALCPARWGLTWAT